MKTKVFVFGSNTEGRHGKGAAKTALDKYGAIYGQARGRQGNSYAIVTKDLSKGMRSIPLGSIYVEVQEFIEYAIEHQECEFIVTEIGCNLAGYIPEEIGPMFKGSPNNVILPESFENILNKRIVLGVTGHRPHKLGNEYDYEGPYSNFLISGFNIIFDLYDPRYVIGGMALGVDTLFVLTAMMRGIEFIAAIPCEGQELVWGNKEARELYWKMLNHPLCIEKKYVSTGKYTPAKMNKRNKWIVDNIDVLVSVWDGTPGGTCNCVQYADSIGRRRININPKDIKL